MMRPEFILKHVGINPGTDEAEKIGKLLEEAFGQKLKEGQFSYFAGPGIEIMKEQGRGIHGHLGFGTPDLEAAVEYLKDRGMTPDESSIKYNEQGRMRTLYFKELIGGFAVHLMHDCIYVPDSGTGSGHFPCSCKKNAGNVKVTAVLNTAWPCLCRYWRT